MILSSAIVPGYRASRERSQALQCRTKVYGIRKNLLVLSILLCFSTRAQQNETHFSGTIFGQVVDSTSGETIEYATVGLVRQNDGKTINGVTSDMKGAFRINKVPEGKYKVLFYFVGYKQQSSPEITINKSNENIDLGKIRLAGAQTSLKEITVVTEKSIIENKIDKMVYNADRDLTTQGGVATDILRKVPQISVDINGNVELQGNNNIRFLINGKPSSMFGNNIADVLQSIPASQIQSIEVITSPGARYDAEGGGIINIILKKNTAQGYNGNVSLTAGTRLENGSLNLSAKKGKFGISTFFTGNAQLLSTTLNDMNRTSQDTALKQTSILLQNGSSDFRRAACQTGINADWAITEKDNLSASLTYNNFQTLTSGSFLRQSITQNTSGANLSDINSEVLSENKMSNHVLDWNLNYKKNFKKEGQELDLLYTASIANNLFYYQQMQKLPQNNYYSAGSYGHNPGNDRQSNIALNYTQPVNSEFSLETGAKVVLWKVTSKSDVYLLDPVSNDYNFNSTQSSNLSYDRNVYAGYLSAVFKMLKIIDVKAGCRYEYTETRAHFSNSGTVPLAPYGSIIPSVMISHQFKNNQTLKLAYSRRISRPNYRDINPFINASDPKNVTMGNPLLVPERSENIEFGYARTYKKGASINVLAFCRGNFHDIQAYSRFYPDLQIGDTTFKNVAVSTRENIGTEYNIGINLFCSVPITSKINFRSNISGFQRYIQSIYPDGNIEGFMYRITLNAAYMITKSLSAEFFWNLNSPRLNVQGVQPTFTTYNFAVRKSLFDKKGSLAITATNPFNKYVPQKTELTGTNFISYNTLLLPYRSFGVNFTYKFGKLDFKKQKEIEDINLTNPPIQGY